VYLCVKERERERERENETVSVIVKLIKVKSEKGGGEEGRPLKEWS